MESDDRQGLASFFVPDEPLVPGTSVLLGEANLQHVRVRRLGVGTRLTLVDGVGHRAVGTLVRLTKAMAAVEIDAVSPSDALPAVHLIVPIADRDRMLWLGEKCAELGATSWRPVLFRRSHSVKPRGEGAAFSLKLRLRMIAALEQSGGSWLPSIYPESTLGRSVGALPSGARLVLDPHGAPIRSLPLEAPVSIAVGPEGGWEAGELAEFDAAGFERVALGGNILRFETAAVAALAIVRSTLAFPTTPHVA